MLGITKSVKKKPPVSGITYQGGSYGAVDCDFKRMGAALCPLLGVKRTSARVLRMSVPHPEFRPGSRSKSIDDRVHCIDLVLSIDFSSVRSSTKRMATGRLATPPAMPALKCRGVQRLSALSTASR